MILDNPYICQHGIKYDKQTIYCYYQACQYERRLENLSCAECRIQIHQHDDKDRRYYMQMQSELKFSYLTYGKICNLEFDILNKQIDLKVLQENIQYCLSLIENVQFLEKIPQCLLFKTFQISQLLMKINQNILDDSIKEFVQFSKKLQQNNKQLNLIQKSENQILYKAYNTTHKFLNFIALSPNEKYLLIGTDKFVYLYDIQTKLNIKIYKFKEKPHIGQFSHDSSQIILACSRGITIFDIQTCRKINIKINYQSKILKIHVYQNQLHLIQQIRRNNQYALRFIKFCLNPNRIIFSQIARIFRHQVYFSKDQISYVSKPYLFIIDSSTRKVQLKFDLTLHQIQRLIVLNSFEILSLLNDSSLIIWKINYQDKCLVKQNIIPLNATDILGGNTFYGLFYLIFNNEIFIVDQKTQNECIYSGKFGQFQDRIISSIKTNTQQFNSDKIFIVISNGWICILERHNGA